MLESVPCFLNPQMNGRLCLWKWVWCLTATSLTQRFSWSDLGVRQWPSVLPVRTKAHMQHSRSGIWKHHCSVRGQRNNRTIVALISNGEICFCIANLERKFLRFWCDLKGRDRCQNLSYCGFNDGVLRVLVLLKQNFQLHRDAAEVTNLWTPEL